MKTIKKEPSQQALLKKKVKVEYKKKIELNIFISHPQKDI